MEREVGVGGKKEGGGGRSRIKRYEGQVEGWKGWSGEKGMSGGRREGRIGGKGRKNWRERGFGTGKGREEVGKE